MERYIDYISRTDFTDSCPPSEQSSDYLYSKDSVGSLTLRRIPGILQMSSKAVGTCKKRGYVKKKFRPLISELPDIMIPTNKRDKHDQFVLVDISLRDSTDVRARQKTLTASISEYLGSVDTGFSSNVMRRLATGHWRRKIDRSYQSSISDRDLMEDKRIDYLDALTVSIDPDGCEDIDDALSILPIDGDCDYEIGIHIADPTSYIIENSELDREALNRSESVYLNEVSHMYPIELTRLFSLNQNESSRAFSVIFRVTKNDSGYDMSNVRIEKTMICVDANLSYDDFEASYSDSALYQALHNFGRHLYSEMVDRDTTLFDSKKMVQAFMVYANSVVANTLVHGDRKSCPRVILRSQPRVAIDNGIDSHFQDVNSDLIDLHYRMRWSSAIMKFWTDDESDSHFGVGLQLYTHFTSPIRRYTDILIHRLLWNAVTLEKVFALNNLNSDENCRDLQTLFTLNHNKRFYRRMINFERDWKIIDKIGITKKIDMEPINLTGNIIAIGETYLKVIIDSESAFHGMILRVEVMSKKMLESFENSNKRQDGVKISILEYQRNQNTIISIKRYDMDEPYRLFDTIKISVVFVSGIRRFRGFIDS